MTAKDGRVSRLENVFIRGGNIKFIVLPELLKASPLLKKIQAMKKPEAATRGPAKRATNATQGGGATKKAKKE